MIKYKQNYATPQGNSSGSVERAVASDTRGPQFESSHWQTLKLNMFLLLSVGKTKIKKKKKKPWITQLLDIASNVLKMGHSLPLFSLFLYFLQLSRNSSIMQFYSWLNSNRGFLVSEATILPTEPHHCPSSNKCFFLKKWANPGLFLFIFVIFSLQFQ